MIGLRPGVIAAGLVLALLLASCSSSTAAAPTVTDAWVRPSTGMQGAVAAYFTITNSTGRDDALLSASSPIAKTVELHETSTDASGMTGMQPIDRVAVASGATVTLAPGGMHVMLMDLTQALPTGGTVELDLVFEHGGKVVVQAEVRQG